VTNSAILQLLPFIFSCAFHLVVEGSWLKLLGKVLIVNPNLENTSKSILIHY
jgi:hypothetical protein